MVPVLIPYKSTVDPGDRFKDTAWSVCDKFKPQLAVKLTHVMILPSKAGRINMSSARSFASF